MGLTSMQTFEVCCDWESDNAACGQSGTVFGRDLFAALEKLRYAGWLVRVYNHEVKAYCPMCKTSDHIPKED